MEVNVLMELLSTIETFFSNYFIWLGIVGGSFSLKFIFLVTLIYHWQKKTVHISSLYKIVLLLVFASGITDAAWIIKIVSILYPSVFNYSFVITFIRFSWLTFVIQYLSIGLLVYQLIPQQEKSLYVRISSPILLFFSTILIIIFCDSHVTGIEQRWWIEPIIQNIIIIYFATIFIPIIIFSSFKKLRYTPIIIQKQFKIITFFYIIPQVFSDFIHINPFCSPNINMVTESYAFVAISTMLLNCMIYFCARHIIRLRFLNFKKHIEHTTLDYHFDEVFQKGLIELGSVTTLDQLGEHIQNFFFRLFAIPQRAVKTHIHLSETYDPQDSEKNTCQTLNLFNAHLQKDHEEIIFKFFHEHSIAIRHELEFNNFYNKTKQDTTILELLSNLKTDLLVPIIYKDSILGYISMADEESNHYTLFTKSQQKATIIFASYLGTFAHILQNKRLETIETKAYAVDNQLFESQQRLTYYQEGIKTLLQEMQTTMVGLFIYYKNKIHPLNENIFNHYLTHQTFLQHCQKLVMQKSTANNTNCHDQTIKIDKAELHCSSIPLPHKNYFLIAVRHQTLATKIQSFAFKNPETTHLPCTFYIFATKKGKLIDDYVPYSTETFIQFKIKLMQVILNKKPIMLYGEKNDLKKVSLFIHSLSEGATHHYFDPKSSHHTSAAQILFGIQDLYEKSNTDKGLLEVCNDGTLIIENIEHMPHQLQIDFTRFLLSGTYLPSKGFHPKTSNARVIILNTYDALNTSQPHSMIRTLEEILSQQTLYCPRLELFSEHEYISLIEETIERNSPGQLSLEQRNAMMHAFLIKRPQNISEFEKRIDENLHQKQHGSYEKNYYLDSEETIQKIILQGKKSLQDPESMRVLWNKFDKNQSYIASLLKVNRSSVNRRVKEYNL